MNNTADIKALKDAVTAAIKHKKKMPRVHFTPDQYRKWENEKAAVVHALWIAASRPSLHYLCNENAKNSAPVEDTVYQRIIDECKTQMAYSEDRAKAAAVECHQREVTHQQGRWQCANDLRKWAQKNAQQPLVKGT